MGLGIFGLPHLIPNGTAADGAPMRAPWSDGRAGRRIAALGTILDRLVADT